MPCIRLLTLVLIAFLCGCSASPQPPVVDGPPTTAPQTTPTNATATEPPATPTLVPPLAGTPTDAPTEMPADDRPAQAAGEVVLRLPAGSGPGQVGITNDAAPPTFRIAADGSIRIMDTVNKRLLFFNGASGPLERTIDLQALQHPIDFAVSGSGDVFVLDAGAWSLTGYGLDGQLEGNTPTHPLFKGLFSTISLDAHGGLWGVGDQVRYTIMPAEAPLDGVHEGETLFRGVPTVRSPMSFEIRENSRQPGGKLLSINNFTDGSLAQFDLGDADGDVSFLDVNQGMEPYVQIANGTTTQVRRFSVTGDLLGSLTIDRSGCRMAARAVYVDRPGDVYGMCADDAGVTVTRYVMTDDAGSRLPLFDQLVTDAPWSPGTLQPSPG
jgi:hypothetical protein